ncbi:ROK family protein [Kribbella flavida]|nr:ROK family protein [Kribbella flavida]
MPSTATDLRQANLTRALRAIHTAEADLTRAQLARELTCTRATAAALAADLQDLGLITVSETELTRRRGRPSTRLTPAATGPAVIAVEIGVTCVRLATVGLGGRLSAVESTALQNHDVDHVLGLARDMLRERLRSTPQPCVGVGIAVHGLVDQLSMTLVSAPNLGWDDTDVVAQLDLPPGLPVRMDNVAHLSALAESSRGRGRGFATVLYLHAAVGLGGALVLDGHPVRGRRGFAGEFGHLPLGRSEQPCRCGGWGCWELDVDQPALARAAGRPYTARTVATVARKVLADSTRGDQEARSAVDQVSALLGRGIGALINVHDPDLVVLACHAADLLASSPQIVVEQARRGSMSAHRPALPPIEPAALDADGALVGAADSLFDFLVESPTALTGRTAASAAPLDRLPS